MPDNTLFYGDNLDVLRQHVKDESVDLIYLDPPFNSNADYNVLFAEQDGTRAAAQLKAFGDTWRWDQAAASAYQEFVVTAPQAASLALQAFQTLLGCNDMLAYLSMMAPRLVELHRVLKPTGSIYLHCDPTASHYLKILLDAIFGKENYRNEIVWHRTMSKGLMTRRLPTNHDILFCYQKSGEATWVIEEAFSPYDESNLDEKTAGKYARRDQAGRLYQLTSLLNPNLNRPNLTYEFLGMTKVWRWTKERMNEALERGLIVQNKPGAVPRFKRYLDEQRGKPFGDVWSDIPPINSQAQERLGYPTQKPEALLERIIRISSKEGDTVLDPFCGCGTTVAVGQRLGRRWLGIDITHLAITLIKSRLLDSQGPDATKTYKVIGEPTTIHDARTLAHEKDRYQFQYWSLGLVGARPLQSDQKKGADKGIDGRLFFHDDAESAKTKQVIFSVKSGYLKADDVRAISHVLEREKAEIGVLITMEEPTQKMRTDAASVGFYKSPWGTTHPRLQILTVAELLDGKKVDMPPSLDLRTFKKAPKAKKESTQKEQRFQFEDDEDD